MFNYVKEAAAKHMIQKQFIEVSFDDISDAFALQNYVAEIFYDRILPRMEILFNEFADETHLISFDVLKIDCPMLSRQQWEQEWVEETLAGLRKELLAANKIKIEPEFSVEKIQGQFLFFLKHGHLPWNSGDVSIKDLEELQLNSEFVEQIKELIQAEEKAADRLVFNFSEQFLNGLIQLLAEKAQKSVAEQLAFSIETMPRTQRALIQSNLIKALCSKEPYDALAFPVDELKKSPANLVSQKVPKEVADSRRKEKKDEPESIYVNNAGLVILHPYLLQLFSLFDLIRNESWKNETSQHSAMIILQYLVSGNDEYPEFNLPLNKILCGLSPSEALKTQDPLSGEMKEECDHLIEAVIQHWTALKNTGVDAFRETFLLRFGKLTQVDNGWLLQVEQKAVDVLLSHLPWGIGTIRLPWMDKILYTEWC